LIPDPVRTLQPIVCAYLTTTAGARRAEADGIIGKDVQWRPHILEYPAKRAWWFHFERPESDFWFVHASRARARDKELTLGVVAPSEVLSDDSILGQLDELGCALLTIETRRDSFGIGDFYASACDFIYQRRLQLPTTLARTVLDRALSRAVSEPNDQRKGVLLEVAAATLLSQVNGFEVTQVGLSSRSQQLDVVVTNRNVGGPLSMSPVVLVEAKNWSRPVGTSEYALFIRKLQSRHGRAKLGYFVTTDRFTAGVRQEMLRESTGETLAVLLDDETFARAWRDTGSITENIERITVEATVGR
jgi:hypothetical protein